MSQFVDECQICVKAGDGGAGAVSMRREAHVPRGGPDGGDGGAGGAVWLVADHNVSSLLAFRDHPHLRASSGGHGQGKRRHGSGGTDLEVAVPVGTIVSGPDGTMLVDLDHDGDRWLAAPGGEGGRGNARFLSNRRRAPNFAEQGEHAPERWLRLELKLFADVALVGFPNVGKSTLISAISAARPKIADYPFTTLEPHLGVVRRGASDLIVADLPGLIEGAADGRGLGLRFLRHVDRARVLVLLLDLAGGTGLSAADQERALLRELGGYRAELLDRPRLLVGSRADLAVEHRDGLSEVSAVTHQGLDVLVGRMFELVSSARTSQPATGPATVLRPVPQGVNVERTDRGFRVVGRPAERAVALSDMTNPDALDYARSRLDRLGVNRALARAGARPGDTVQIGELEFTYEPDA